MWLWILLPPTALVTAVISGMIGMGGGVLLLAVMLSLMPHAEAIPAHAAIQLLSNGTRTVAFLPEVEWRTVGRFLLGVVPGSTAGVGLLLLFGQPGASEPFLKMLVGAYILAALLWPQPRDAVERPGRWWDFPLLGLAAGAAAFTVGAVGPLIGPLFARRDFMKERLVATKAVCQSLLHLAKIPVFLVVRDYSDLPQLGTVTIIAGLLTIPGTLLGKRLLRYLSARHFMLIYQGALLVAGLKVLLVDGVWECLQGSSN